MAKKSRRAQSRQAAREPAAHAQPEAQTKVEATCKTVDFSQEYHYVIRDLRNMAILAVGMLVVLVGLSFIVQ